MGAFANQAYSGGALASCKCDFGTHVCGTGAECSTTTAQCTCEAKDGSEVVNRFDIGQYAENEFAFIDSFPNWLGANVTQAMASVWDMTVRIISYSTAPELMARGNNAWRKVNMRLVERGDTVYHGR